MWWRTEARTQGVVMKHMNDQMSGRVRRWAVALAAVSVLAACDDDVAPPTAIEGTGSVEGLLFYDANRDGLFDPSAGDEALPGVQLVLRQRGTEDVLAGGTAVTGDDGRFSMTGVPLGTHELFVNESTAPEFATFCRNPIPVSVYRNETQFEDVDARQSCLVTIAVAEEQPLGEYVTVSGIVVSGSGMIRPGYIHIEDESGGVRLFDYALDDLGLEVGDRLEASGTLAAYGGDFQITGITVNAVEEDAADPQPTLVTTAEISEAGLDGKDPLLGRLVKVEGAELVSEFGADGMHYRNALIDTGEGATIVRLEEAVGAGTPEIEALMTVGSCYDITGVTGTFSQEGQIFPRTPADIVEVACP